MYGWGSKPTLEVLKDTSFPLNCFYILFGFRGMKRVFISGIIDYIRLAFSNVLSHVFWGTDYV